MKEPQIYREYVDLVTIEGEQSRQSAAKNMGKALSTAAYNLDKAVERGALERYYAWRRNNQTGYMYCLPGKRLRYGESEEGEDEHWQAIHMSDEN